MVSILMNLTRGIISLSPIVSNTEFFHAYLVKEKGNASYFILDILRDT